VQLLESGDPTLTNHIRTSPLLSPHIRQLAQSPVGTPSSLGSRSQSRSRPGSFSEGTGDGEGGASEITALARRILEVTEGEGAGVVGSLQEKGDDELRKSVRDALMSGQRGDEK